MTVAFDYNSPDEVLMQQLTMGEIEALGPIYQRYGDAVMRMIATVLVNSSSTETEDLCQEVFMTAADVAPQYEEQGKLRMWLMGIAVRKARSWQRQRWLRSELRRIQLPACTVSPSISMDNPENSVLHCQEIEHALKRLPRSQREVLMLHAHEGMTGVEISETLGISPVAVWSRLRRANKTLAKITTRSKPNSRTDK